MALTPEFMSAISERNILRIRIILKDSLLVDKTFKQFEEMRNYAERSGINVWMNETEKEEIPPKETWNMDLMNLELTRLVNEFTVARVNFCMHLIRTLYVSQNQYITPVVSTVTTVNTQKNSGVNRADYHSILNAASIINNILKENKTENGRIWTYKDIETIRSEANKISQACDNVMARRGQNGSDRRV